LQDVAEDAVAGIAEKRDVEGNAGAKSTNRIRMASRISKRRT
jgi:hypothetical protein